MFAAYLVLLRIGWVFKTESVVLPAFLDTLGANAAARGLLPVISRWGNSVPQYVLARSIRRHPRFKPTLLWASAIQALPWLVLPVCLWSTPSATGGWWIAFFLVLYAVFWVANGVALLAQGALQGKLIVVHRRGRLLTVSNIVGCLTAIAALLIWMVPILSDRSNAVGFAWIFAASGVVFLAMTACVVFFMEEPIVADGGQQSLFEHLAATRRLVQRDHDFRRLLSIVSAFYMILALFPHFASFGIAEGGAGLSHLVYWVIAQNAGTAAGSLLVGPIVDRRGNRDVLRGLLIVLGFAPLVAMLLTATLGADARNWYWLVFTLLGLTPVAQRTVVNYVLELAPAEDHTSYLATLNLWQIAPLFMAPGIGLLIDYTSFSVAFSLGSAVLFVGVWLACFLIEPRTQRRNLES